MKRELALEFARVSEKAAMAAYSWVGQGDKELADQAAVEAMRRELNNLDINAEIVIGEGEIDEAPMLYIGEKLGSGRGPEIDIAVDPIEGTRMTALGQANAITVMVAGDRGSLLKAPDMYMEKLIVSPALKDCCDLSLPLYVLIQNWARTLQKPISELTILTLEKNRHQPVIQELHHIGVRVLAIPDGDVVASILVQLPDAVADVYYGIGGAPEGVISAAVVKMLGGNMQARLKLRSDVKGKTIVNEQIDQEEISRCQQMDIMIEEIISLDHLVKSDQLVFVATGVTDGDLLRGIVKKGNRLESETLMIRGGSKTICRIQSEVLIEKQPIMV